jgi:aspartate/methionine/tyrosine aminotransferase
LRPIHVAHRRSHHLFLAKELGTYSKAARLADRGELIHMELRQPVHDTPQHIKAATIAAITAGQIKRFASEKTRANL